MKMNRWGIIPLVAIVPMVIAGCAPSRPVDVGPQVATADNLAIAPPTEPPPPDQQDVIPACPGMPPQWWFIPGYWDWRGQWVWVPGHWRPRPHSGDVWISGKWLPQNTGNGTIYVWHGGHWRSGAPADLNAGEH